MLNRRILKTPLALGSMSVLVLGMLAVGATVARGAPHHGRLPAKPPPGNASAGMVAITAVPHSSDVWAIGFTGPGPGNYHYYLMRRHHGRWQKLKAPSLNGRYGELNTMAAASPKAVWLGGATQQGHGSIQGVNSIWRLKGKKFVRAKLPATDVGATSVTSISASSASNAWAVGDEIYTTGPTATLAALHWNGKTWSAAPTPVGLNVVSTSGPFNAWGTDGSNLVSWNGSAWVLIATAPTGEFLSDIATSSAKLAYAVGYTGHPGGYGKPAVMRFNGQVWETARVAKNVGHGELYAVTMHGRSAWAIGSHLTKKGATVPLILHSTGGVWREQHTVGVNYSLRSISAASTKRVYAAGSYTNSARAERTFFDVFNGHSWKGESSKL